MTRTARLLIAAGLLTGLAGAANAADLVTSVVDCTGRYFGCIAFNVGNKPLDVTVESLGVRDPRLHVPSNESADPPFAAVPVDRVAESYPTGAPT